jgi:GMP synthase (glutamine-hydrolysing)
VTGPVRPVLVLQHAAWERPGLVADSLVGIPVTVRTVVSEPEPELPSPDELAGLVVMGGPQDADDDGRWPGLPAERRLLADAVDAGLPVLGVCLGMQLLALALGAPLHRRHGTEIGFAPVHVVGEDKVLAPLGARPTVLHWHSDAVDLPAGATLLAATPATPVQAFRAGTALGLQFHLEVGLDLLAEWARTPTMAGGVGDAEIAGLLRDGARHLPGLREPATAGLSAFAGAVRERG